MSNKDKVKEARLKEIDFWKESDQERPNVHSVETILEKSSNAKIFLKSLSEISNINLSEGSRVLEIGGGQGWASCVLKSLNPKINITTTDISDDAISSIQIWENIFKSEIDNKYACTADKTREKDEAIDFIFTFASAHHFITHRTALNEIYRILKVGGKCAYIFEPVTPAYLYSMAYKRVNRMRPEVPEDVLIISKLKSIALDNGLRLETIYTPYFSNRTGIIGTVYYCILYLMPFLQRLLPSTATLVFTKIS